MLGHIPSDNVFKFHTFLGLTIVGLGIYAYIAFQEPNYEKLMSVREEEAIVKVEDNYARKALDEARAKVEQLMEEAAPIELIEIERRYTRRLEKESALQTAKLSQKTAQGFSYLTRYHMVNVILLLLMYFGARLAIGGSKGWVTVEQFQEQYGKLLGTLEKSNQEAMEKLVKLQKETAELMERQAVFERKIELQDIGKD